MLQEPELDDDERAEILEANAALQAVTDAALISRGLGISVTPWSLDAWPIDILAAARALARRWMKTPHG